ncbi:MAG: hypothetical protein ACYTXT_41850 [Nostoc sp.]
MHNSRKRCIRPSINSRKLVQLNSELVAAAQKMEATLATWSDELDKFLDVPFKLDPLPTPGLRLIDGWLYDSHGSRTNILS